MYFTFACPRCEKKLRVAETAAGRKAACPFCRASFVVPAPPVEQDDPMAALREIGETGGESLADRVARGKRRRRERAEPPRPRSGWAERTDVSILRSVLLGSALAAAFLALVFPVRNLYLGELFFHRGWVPFALVFLMGWSAAILFLKWRKLKRQRASMLFDLLPNDLAEDITADSVDRFVQHVRSLPAASGESFLINRVLRALEHFKVRQSNPEVVSLLASQSEIDANAVQSSYTLLNVFVWAIPILGFIGTVIGISAAVGGFSGSMEQAADITALKESLNSVTAGLATAFDTTLVALVMSMLVMFPSSSMQKAEEDLLNSVDEYCNENLLKRLNDGSGQLAEGAPQDGSSAAVRRAVDAVIKAHRQEMAAWTEQLQKVGSAVSSEVAETWRKINEEIKSRQQQNADQTQDVEKCLALFQQRLDEVVGTTGQAHNRAAEAMEQAARSLQAYCAALEQGLGRLNDVLAQLGQRQVVIQAPPRRRWFFFGNQRR